MQDKHVRSKKIFKNRFRVGYGGRLQFSVWFSGHPQTHVFLGRNVISLLTLSRYNR